VFLPKLCVCVPSSSGDTAGIWGVTMPFDIHCPNCGEFQDRKNVSKGCPRCGNRQAISLWHREDIDERFKLEREGCTKEWKWGQGR